jgi:hypothetical protein
MTRPVRIGNAHGFWGDRIEAAAEMLAAEPDLDFVTFDFLAEVSMSILALQRSRHPDTGWPRDVLDVIQSLTPYWRQGGNCRMIANAGGLNPVACAKACQKILIEAGCGNRSIAVVHGDDVLDQLRLSDSDSLLFRNLDTDEPLSVVKDRLVTANAYLGAKPIADALAGGADIVITGRVADPSLTVGACAYFHNWKWDDWDRLAQATVAGHLIECGTQVSGGIFTDWLDIPHAERIGFPIVEIDESGSFAVTKTPTSGGAVTELTVKEQLVYEIGDPGAYLSPDVTVSFLSLDVHEETTDRVRVRGAAGRPPSPSYKVSATYHDGYRAQGQLTIYGDRAVAKARRAGEAVIERLASRGVTFRESVIECLGAEACNPAGADPAALATLRETVLRIAVSDDSKELLEQFVREMMPLITAGPPGTTGYAEGRPRIHPVFRYWPCLIERDRVDAVVTQIELDSDQHDGKSTALPGQPVLETATETPRVQAVNLDRPTTLQTASEGLAAIAERPVRLADIALTRSGDKGRDANIGVIARQPADYDVLYHNVTAAHVAAFLGLADASRVIRYELPNLGALNFVVRGILANSLRVDAQGKTLGQVLLNMPLNLQARTGTP